jgi:hypothetical protein
MAIGPVSDSSEYGPHTTQLKLLAERLAALSADEWQTLDEGIVVSEACFGSFDWMSFTDVLTQDATEDWCKLAEQFTRAAKPEHDDYPEAAKRRN